MSFSSTSNIPTQSKLVVEIPPLISLAFILLLFYWIYLISASNMIISEDADNYVKLATLLHQEGMMEYFRTGPHREPLYPITVAVSLKLEKIFSISFMTFQKIFQMGCLFLTLLMSFLLLKRLNINRWIIFTTVLYMGVSPALVNSGMSLFSEIISYPLVLGIIITAVNSLHIIQHYSVKNALVYGLLLGVLFIALISVKTIFLYILPVFILPFIYLCAKQFKSKVNNALKKTVIFLTAIIITTSSFIFWYQSMNLIHNNNFTFTDRGAWFLYTNAYKRMQTMHKTRFLAFLSKIPGDSICNSLIEKKECDFWSTSNDTVLAHYKKGEFRGREIPTSEYDALFIDLAKKEILKNPIRYFFFSAVTSLKMIFWESTKTGFVEYPEWLAKIYQSNILNGTLRLTTALLTLMALVSNGVQIFKNKKLLMVNSSEDGRKFQILFFIFLIIFSVIGIYSLFEVIVRYSFPIVPLYLIVIAVFIHNFAFEKTFASTKTNSSDPHPSCVS